MDPGGDEGEKALTTVTEKWRNWNQHHWGRRFERMPGIGITAWTVSCPRRLSVFVPQSRGGLGVKLIPHTEDVKIRHHSPFGTTPVTTSVT